MERLLRRPQVEKRVGLARSTIYAMMAQGRFPKPVHITGRAVAWRSGEIDRWIETRERQVA